MLWRPRDTWGVFSRSVSVVLAVPKVTRKMSMAKNIQLYKLSYVFNENDSHSTFFDQLNWLKNRQCIPLYKGFFTL